VYEIEWSQDEKKILRKSRDAITNYYEAQN